jgi:hypothetical protein
MVQIELVSIHDSVSTWNATAHFEGSESAVKALSARGELSRNHSRGRAEDVSAGGTALGDAIACIGQSC